MLVDASHILVLCVPVLGFFAVGVTLAEEAEEGAMKFPPPFTPQIGVAILLRGIVAPLVLLGLAAPFIDLPDAFLLAATMPAGLHIVVLAHIYGLDVVVRRRRDHVDDDGRGARPARRVRRRLIANGHEPASGIGAGAPSV